MAHLALCVLHFSLITIKKKRVTAAKKKKIVFKFLKNVFLDFAWHLLRQVIQELKGPDGKNRGI